MRLEPFLHVEPTHIFNPLRDLTITSADRDFEQLAALASGRDTLAALMPSELDRFRANGWLVADDGMLDRRSRIKYVSLEASSACNQSCNFCPVAESPRPHAAMPTALYEAVVRQLAAYRDTIEGVFTIGYNEPTLDPRFVDQVRLLNDVGLPVAVLSNGTGLTPARVDRVIASGGLRYLSINLSTLDPAAYERQRGVNHLSLVLKHLDYFRDLPVAQQMEIVVLGTGDEAHEHNVRAIEERFAGSRLAVKRFEIMNRAGRVMVGARPPAVHRCLRGCNQMGSRPLQHLHITAEAKCLLCCEDYDERYVIGDLTSQTIADVLAGPEAARLRRWTYGLEQAPDDFICRRCIFAVA